MKKFIKKIPVLGWFLRWSYNLLRLNNLKHFVYVHQHSIETIQNHLETSNRHIQAQQERLESQKTQLESQKTQLESQQAQINSFENSIDSKIAKQISYQSVSFQQRIDQFIFDTKIDLKNEKL